MNVLIVVWILFILMQEMVGMNVPIVVGIARGLIRILCS